LTDCLSSISAEAGVCEQGRNVLQGLIAAARDRNIKLRIVNNVEKVPSNDTVDLVNAGTRL